MYPWHLLVESASLKLKVSYLSLLKGGQSVTHNTQLFSFL